METLANRGDRLEAKKLMSLCHIRPQPSHVAVGGSLVGLSAQHDGDDIIVSTGDEAGRTTSNEARRKLWTRAGFCSMLILFKMLNFARI